MIKPKVDNCVVCAKELNGRDDKRYCCTKCKNIHHKTSNQLKLAHMLNYIKNIQRNYVVLEGVMGKIASKVTIQRETLFKFGFDQFSITGTYVKDGVRVYQIGKFNFTITNQKYFEIYREDTPSSKPHEFYKRWEVEFPNDLGGSYWDSEFKRE